MKRLALLIVLALAGLLALAGPALAHVTVTAPGATAGGTDQEITFRVPVEKDADTVGLTIALPANTPIAGVLVAPMAGWTHTQKLTELANPIKTDDGEITEYVSQITWTAARGNGLKPGEFGDFTIIAGQLPESATSLTFKALQSSADGTVTRWIETAAPGSNAEPANPAPVLQLAKAGASPSAASPSAASASVASQTSSAATGTTGQATVTATSAGTSASSSNTGPVVLSIIALVLAAGAIGYAFVTRARSRT
jgi:uncharacterized protein